MTVRRTISVLAATALGLAATALGATPAQADGFENGSGGNQFTVSVNATVTGDAGDPLTGGGGSTISISVPPKCWWTTWNPENMSYADPPVAPGDKNAMTKYFKWLRLANNGTFAPARLGIPSEEYVAAHDGPEWTWYSLNAADGVNCADEGFTPSGGQGPPDWQIGGSNNYPVGFAAFQGAEPAPPLVDVEEVVDEVWEQATAEVDAPDLDRNPKIDTVGGASLVNLDTWFWVQNVQEALANDGEIHLDVAIPGTPVQARLDAATDGVQISSPVGATSCTVAAAKTEWSSGTSEDSACTLAFERANTGGWPVSASINWAGTWQGADANGPAGGVLAPINQTGTVDVPVAESQALVNDVD